MTDPEASPLDLFRRWWGGDDAAKDQLLVTIRPMLAEDVRRYLGNKPRLIQGSEDMAQNAVVNFLERGPRFIPETEAQFRALLRRIARNQVIDEDRRQSLRGRGGHLESAMALSASFAAFGPAARSVDSPDRLADRNTDAEWMRLALHFLEPEQRHLLWASEVEGQKWSAIAADLGFSTEDAARVACGRLKGHVAVLMLRLRRGQMPTDPAAS